jgi:signal transduction histidine kinase
MQGSASFLKIITGEVSERLMVINSDYRVVYAGPLVSQLGALRGEEIQGRFCYQVLRQREDPCEEMDTPCPLQQVMKSGKPFKSFQSYLNAKREEVPFSVDCYPLKGEGEEVVQAVYVMNNLEESDKMELELGRICRFAAIGELFHGIAHNLNTPLSAVMARAEMLEERLRKLKGVQGESKKESESASGSNLDKNIRDADVIVSNAMKLSEIIRNMMQKGMQEGEAAPQMLNLSYLLKEELKFLEADMKFKHEIKKTYALEESIPYIEGVYFHFSQSFTNIIKNVMESIDGSEIKELTVSSRYDKENICIEIHDTGLEAKEITHGREPLTPGEMRLNHALELLKPYKAELKVRSKPHDNLYTICIPYKNEKL